jgi:hypothetical protein
MPSISSAIDPGSLEDRTIAGFRARHGMSKATYYRMVKDGRGPRMTVYGHRTIRITKKDEAEFDRRQAKSVGTEARLLQKLQAKRTAMAKKAAAASLAGKNHVSRRRHRRG